MGASLENGTPLEAIDWAEKKHHEYLERVQSEAVIKAMQNDPGSFAKALHEEGMKRARKRSADAVEEIITDPETGGKKGRKLARTDLLPTDALMTIAEHYGRGALKYEDRNWERGYAWSLSYGALLRHLFAWWGGEDIDAETGSSHLVAVGWHALALIAFETREVGTDDRP